MVGEIKLFRYVQKFYRMTGIYPSKSCHHHSLSVKNTFSLISLIAFFLSTFGYFLFKANTVNEYGMCFYASFSMLEILLYFIVNLLKIQKILNLIERCEDFIAKSKFSFLNQIYFSE